MGSVAAEDDTARVARPPAEPCKRELATVAVVDDEAGALPSVAEQYRRLGLPALAVIARRVMEAEPCLGLWEANSPWGASRAPDFAFRVKPSRIGLVERTLATKAEGAINRYLGSYLGTVAEEIPLVDRAEVAVTLMCPGRKASLAASIGTSDASGDGDPHYAAPLAHPMDLNANRFARALRQAMDEYVARMRNGERICAVVTP
jgi:hypothetical protein